MATTRTPGHAFKMGIGQVRNKLDEATPEEKAQLLNMIREIEEQMGFKPEPVAVSNEVEDTLEEAVEAAVPDQEPSHDRTFRDLSHVRERMERRLKNVERALDRGQNVFENAINADAIRDAIQLSYEAEKIPAVSRRYGCMTSREEIVTLDGYLDEHPVTFRDWVYETSDPMEIAFIERRIRAKKEANEHPTIQNQHLRSSAEIIEIGNRVAMVDWNYTPLFRGFKTPDDADFEERQQSQIRASKRMQRLRSI